MRAPRTHVPGIVRRVYARGVGGQDIVAGAEDWDELQALIAQVARACDVRLYAFCLVDWPLSLFAEDGRSATEVFRRFVEAGKGDTRPPRKLFDSRERVLRPLRPRGSAVIEKPPLKELLSQAAASGGVPAAGILGGSRVRRVCAARRTFAAAAFRAGHTPMFTDAGTEAGRFSRDSY